MIKLLIRCLFCWIHGFKTKTGAENWLKRQVMWENNQFKKYSQRRGPG